MNRFWSPTLGEVTEPVRTWNPVRDGKESFHYIELSAVDQEMKTITEPALVEPRHAPSRARQLVRTDDILASTVRPNLNAVARVTEEFDGATASTGFCVLRPSPGKVDPTYLFHWVRTPRFIEDMVRNATGASYPAVSDRIIKSSVLPLPPLDEQRRIAAILDKADALRQKRKRAIALLDSVTRSIFLEMFGDPKAGEGRWATLPVNEICTLVRGSSPRPQGDPRFFGGPVPRLMIADITRDGFWVTPRIDSLTVEGAKRSRPAPSGTVVMAVSGDVGLVSRLAVDACIHDGFVGFLDLDESRFHPVFFMTVLHLMKALHARGTAGAIFLNTTTSEIKKMMIPCPPLALQTAFLSRARLADAVSTEQRRASDGIDTLFTSLQHRAFSGQL